jgi:hypothetical protein
LVWAAVSCWSSQLDSWPARRREPNAGLEAGVDHDAVAVRAIAADQDLPARAGGTSGAIASATIDAAAPAGTGFVGPQPDPGDHRRATLGADRGDQRGQALAQHLLTGDLGAPVAGALLGVPEHRAQQRVDVDECPLLAAGQ